MVVSNNKTRSKKTRDKRDIAKTIVFNILYLILPVALFYLMEAYEHNAFDEVRDTAQIFNIIIFELIAWVVYFLVKKVNVAAVIITVASMIFGLVNHYVVLFRGTPFVPWDIYSVRTAASVATNYDFKPDTRVIVVTVIFVLLMIAELFLKSELRIKIFFRLILAAVVAFGLGLFTHTLWNDDFQTSNYLYPFLFTPGYMTKVNGMAVTFAMDLEYVKVEKPEGYSANEVRKALKSYEDSSDGDNRPNIIVIMDEAFSDLAVLNKFITNEDYIPFMHSLQKGADNTITGYLNVSVCGGNTANSEYEFLTGNTMAFLPAGSIPYQQYIRDEVPTLVWHLKELGYSTYAQHPYLAEGWNRDKVYKWFGFDDLTFVYDYTSRHNIRKYVSDESSFNQIIKTFEEKKVGTPAFIFNVTMQNHGGYTDTYENFENTIRVSGTESDSLNQYLSLMKITDTEYEKLIEYFSQVEEDTVVVFFGDHQPSNAVTSQISGAGIDDPDRYLVPFAIWANYDIEEATGVETSLNFLGAEVLKAAGVATNDYENYLLDLEDEYSVISSMKIEKNDNASDDSLDLYKKIQYYMMFDAEVE